MALLGIGAAVLPARLVAVAVLVTVVIAALALVAIGVAIGLIAIVAIVVAAVALVAVASVAVVARRAVIAGLLLRLRRALGHRPIDDWLVPQSFGFRLGRDAALFDGGLARILEVLVVEFLVGPAILLLRLLIIGLGGGDDAEIMFRVLKIAFRHDDVAR